MLKSVQKFMVNVKLVFSNSPRQLTEGVASLYKDIVSLCAFAS